MGLQEDFKEIRRVATPWVVVQSPDYRAVVSELKKVRVNGEEAPPFVMWDCIRGHRGLNAAGNDAAGVMGDTSETQQAPAMCLAKALDLPRDTVLFMVFPSNESLQSAPVAQAMANLRDEFKADRRTLVVLGGRDLKVAPLVAEDVPVLRCELPNDGELKAVVDGIAVATLEKAENLTETQKKAILKKWTPTLEAAVPLCRGLVRFAAEEGVSRHLGQAGINLKALGELQRVVIEQSTDRALVFEKEPWTFDDVGGLSQWKKFMERLFKGPRPPRLLVRWDEIDKSISAASAGGVADNTGVSQDQLKVLLTTMEENNWTGCILVGGPGSGKTLSTICTGNTFGARTLVGDLGATKDSLVGASERKIRTAMDVLKAVGGKDVLFLATANRLDTLPPELQRRFSLGTWFFDSPNAAEKKVIWKIQRKAFDITDENTPLDNGWVGSDIRNCCRLAYLCGTTLQEASEMITLAGKAAAKDIAKLRETAEQAGFLSANSPGPYKREKSEGRASTITL